MNVIGIVTEYNPLHNGHIYQIKKIKEMYPDSIIVVAMSANYTMRGEISVLDKWTKTKLCLENGIDIVLEIPFIYANQSSDIFSYAAIKMLSAFKIDTLVFGSESNNLDKLKDLSSPIYRLELMMVGRLFAQDPRLYADIIMSSKQNYELIENFVNSLQEQLKVIREADVDIFTERFLNVRKYFGDFSEEALKESGSILAKLQDER